MADGHDKFPDPQFVRIAQIGHRQIFAAPVLIFTTAMSVFGSVPLTSPT